MTMAVSPYAEVVVLAAAQLKLSAAAALDPSSAFAAADRERGGSRRHGLQLSTRPSWARSPGQRHVVCRRDQATHAAIFVDASHRSSTRGLGRALENIPADVGPWAPQGDGAPR